MTRSPVRRTRRSDDGFTLIELLVVLSIISLLVAMLLPALGSSREVARKMLCATNLRQVGIATLLYENEHGSFIRTGRHNGLTHANFHATGAIDSWSRSDFWTLYTEYLGGDLGEITDNGTSRVSAGLRFDPHEVLICPSREPRLNYFWQDYLFWIGAGNNFSVSVDDAQRAAANSGAKVTPGNTFAMWSDATVWHGEANQRSGANHTHNGIQEGGHVQAGDGSVRWHPWVEYGSHGEADIYFTRWPGTNISAPSNMITLRVNGDGDVASPDDSGGNVLWATWVARTDRIFGRNP